MRPILLLIPLIALAQSGTYQTAIPQNLPDPETQWPRALTGSIDVVVDGRPFVVTIHSANGTTSTVTVWQHSPRGYRMVQRLNNKGDAPSFVAGRAVSIGGREHVLLVGCYRHCFCQWSLARVEPGGRLSLLASPRFNPGELLKPGEELFSRSLLNAESLSFVAYVCIPGKMPCYLGDQWQSSDAWGPSGPQILEGHYKIEGNSLKIADVKREEYGHTPGVSDEDLKLGCPSPPDVPVPEKR
jgi:hypothetical protein